MAEARVERRLAAILAADVAGYSRLMGVDEEGTLATLKLLRRELIDPKIAEHRGRVVKTTGDGTLAEFASAVGAVRCAMEIQHGMAERNAAISEDRRIQFRIGINVGDIILDEGDIYGDGVNIAARVEALARPGAICLSDHAYQQIKGKLTLHVSDMGEQQLKNIVQPVRVYALQDESATVISTPSLPDKPSIAVLPFENMSGDPEQEYFADGMVEDIITGLSRLKWFFVVARNSSFTYKGRAVDVRQVGRELGVRYVLEGSVRKGGNRLRITVQLIDATTGNHIWADKYDSTLHDVFELQDRITFDVVSAIEPSLQRAEVERSRRKRPESLDAYDHFLRALPYAWANNPAEATKAVDHLEAALRIDPDYGAAHGLAAWCYQQIFVRKSHDPEDRKAAIQHARAALTGATDDHCALAVAGFVLGFLDRDFRAAHEGLNRALAINTDSAFALGLSALVNVYEGRYDAALQFADKSLRSSQVDPLRHNALAARLLVLLHTGRYAEAMDTAHSVVESAPRFGIGYLLLAAASVRGGNLDEARASIRRLLELEPQSSIKILERANFGPPEATQALIGPLREAGLPEG